MINVLLAEDHQILSQGLKALLTYENGIQIVGEAADGEEAIKILNEKQVHVALLDIEMPKKNGLEVTRYITENKLPTKVVILSMYKKPEYINAAIKFGASGYILKDRTDQQELELAIKEVVGGGLHFGDEILKIQFESQRKGFSDQINLTQREKDVLKQISEGLTSQEIGNKLHIAASTVETHKRHLFKKFDVNSVTQLLKKARDEGYL